METEQNDLFQPSLEKKVAVPLYSQNASFYVAFFGGIFSIIFFQSLNSFKLKRFKIDFIFYLFWMGVGLTLPFFETHKLVSRMMALAAYANFYFLHKKYHKANELFGTESPSPWKPGIFCSLAGISITITAYMIAKAYR
ncbi:hypothetical protein [Leptospira idonii]|uniref:Uncharacterized protein n=1 Tax=Leptospira idonii TaxID=1193500 RepID=A0A4R9LXA5_9LEPT|nr:hypothetical protein [Leptospira idonii]TGN17649.1 hypothetical protein EHS15_16625 [Leptospira idonii]